MTAGVYSTADSPGPDIADNAGPGNRNNRQSGPSNDHNAFPYRPCGRFGSPLGGRRPYGGDCPVSDPAEIAPVCFERSVCSPSCTSETCDQVNGTPVLRCDAWQPVQIPPVEYCANRYAPRAVAAHEWVSPVPAGVWRRHDARHECHRIFQYHWLSWLCGRPSEAW